MCIVPPVIPLKTKNYFQHLTPFQIVNQTILLATAAQEIALYPKVLAHPACAV
jgi:hypothetical protein